VPFAWQLLGAFSPLESIAEIFARAEVNQQLIEARRCVPEGLPISICSNLQHLIEAPCGSFERPQFFSCDPLLGALPNGPNQA
jgi:hypothetical protein